MRCFGANHGVSGLEPIDSHGGQIGDGTTAERHIPITVRKLDAAPTPRTTAPTSRSRSSRAAATSATASTTSRGRTRRVRRRSTPGGTTRLYVKVQNDSNVTDSFFIQGAKRRQRVRGRLRDRRQEHQDGRRQRLLLADPCARRHEDDRGDGEGGRRRLAGSTKVIKVLARSAGDSGKVDVVKGIVKV